MTTNLRNLDGFSVDRRVVRFLKTRRGMNQRALASVVAAGLGCTASAPTSAARTDVSARRPRHCEEQISAFVRRQHAEFLRGQLPSLRDVPIERFDEAIATLAERQLTQTLGHLAARLPIFEVRFEGDTPRVTELRPAR